jgi:hypothetical protein
MNLRQVMENITVGVTATLLSTIIVSAAMQDNSQRGGIPLEPHSVYSFEDDSHARIIPESDKRFKFYRDIDHDGVADTEGKGYFLMGSYQIEEEKDIIEGNYKIEDDLELVSSKF